MDITLIVSAGMAEDLRSGHPSLDISQRLVETIEQYGATVFPMHPQVDHPKLNPFFLVHVSDEKKGRQLAEELFHAAGVESAYIKPATVPAQNGQRKAS